jgi:hypothetical protein
MLCISTCLWVHMPRYDLGHFRRDGSPTSIPLSGRFVRYLGRSGLGQLLLATIYELCSQRRLVC